LNSVGESRNNEKNYAFERKTIHESHSKPRTQGKATSNPTGFMCKNELLTFAG